MNTADKELPPPLSRGCGSGANCLPAVNVSILPRYVRRWNLVTPVPVDRETMERSMHTQQVRPWPAIDLAELRFGIAFGSSVEELADFLRRDVEDIKQKWAAELLRSAPRI
jgi:hypothetical protein